MKIHLHRAYIIILLICLTGFFGLYRFLPLSKQLYSVDLIYIYILFFSIIFIAIDIKKILSKNKAYTYKKKFNRAFIIFVLFISAEVLMSNFNYQQGLVNVLKEAMYYYVFSIVGFLILTINYETINIEWFYKRITQISIACSIVAIIIFASYTYLGIDLIGIAGGQIRNGTVRFGIGSNLVIISIVISITRILNERPRCLDICNLIVGFIQILFINKTRAVILYLMILTCVMCLRMKKVNNLIKFFMWVGILISIIFLIFGNQIFMGKINSFISNDYGMLARMDAIKFYMNEFYGKPLCGMGFISSKKTIAGWELIYGNDGVYYRGDVGFVGLLNGFGVVGLCWAFAFLSKLFNSVEGKSTYSLAVKHIVLYFCISSASLCFMDAERLMCCIIPLIMMILIKIRRVDGDGD